jgi:hypothetical protein
VEGTCRMTDVMELGLDLNHLDRATDHTGASVRRQRGDCRLGVVFGVEQDDACAYAAPRRN